jgi:hypothetical protein
MSAKMPTHGAIRKFIGWILAVVARGATDACEEEQQALICPGQQKRGQESNIELFGQAAACQALTTRHVSPRCKHGYQHPLILVIGLREQMRCSATT